MSGIHIVSIFIFSNIVTGSQIHEIWSTIRWKAEIVVLRPIFYLAGLAGSISSDLFGRISLFHFWPARPTLDNKYPGIHALFRAFLYQLNLTRIRAYVERLLAKDGPPGLRPLLGHEVKDC